MEKLTHWYPEIDFDVIKIDPYEVIAGSESPEQHIRKRTDCLRTVEPLEIKLMSVIHDPNKTSLNVLPIAGLEHPQQNDVWFVV